MMQPRKDNNLLLLQCTTYIAANDNPILRKSKSGCKAAGSSEHPDVEHLVAVVVMVVVMMVVVMMGMVMVMMVMPIVHP